MDMELGLCPSGHKGEIWRTFLSHAELEADEQVEHTALLWDNGQLIATGSRQGNILKCIAYGKSQNGNEDFLRELPVVLRIFWRLPIFCIFLKTALLTYEQGFVLSVKMAICVNSYRKNRTNRAISHIVLENQKWYDVPK